MRLGAFERDFRVSNGTTGNNRYTSPSAQQSASPVTSPAALTLQHNNNTTNNNNNNHSSSDDFTPSSPQLLNSTVAGGANFSSNNNNNNNNNNFGGGVPDPTSAPSSASSPQNNNDFNNMMALSQTTTNPSYYSSNYHAYHHPHHTGQSRLNRDAAFVRDVYTFTEEIGTGAFGRVYKAVKKKGFGGGGGGMTMISNSSFGSNQNNNNNISGSSYYSSSSPGSANLGVMNNNNPTNSNTSNVSSNSNNNNSNQEVFAIKHVDKRKAGAAGLKSVLSEVETLALLNHTYIVRLEEVFQDKDNLYIVMEMVPGGELASALKQLRRLHETVVRKIILCLLLALEYIHDQGIVHRDLKPANCLLSSDGTAVKIADFGFAVMVGPTSCLTENCGTPAYLAPEIVCGENYGRQVDMWSLGVIMYLMLTGDYPFMETQKESLEECICRGRYSTSGKIWESEISAGAKDFLSKLLVTDPSKRWSAHQCLNHSWIRVARPSGGLGGYGAGSLDGLYSNDYYDNEDDEHHHLHNNDGLAGLNQRAISGIQRFQNVVAGNSGGMVPLASQSTSTSRPKRGRMRLRIIFKGAVTAVKAALRLLFFIRLQALRREGLDTFPMLRTYSFVVTRRYHPPNPSLMMCKAVAPGNNRVLSIIVSMFESCPSIEVFDFSNNKIDSLELVQHIVRAVNAHPNLQVLNLDNNPIPPLAGRGLLRLARFHPSLKTLNVNGTNIGQETILQIQTALKENEKKRPRSAGNNNNNAATGQVSSTGSQNLIPHVRHGQESPNPTSMSIIKNPRASPSTSNINNPPPLNTFHLPTNNTSPHPPPSSNSTTPMGNNNAPSATGGGSRGGFSDYRARINSASSNASNTMNSTNYNSVLSTGSRNSNNNGSSPNPVSYSSLIKMNNNSNNNNNQSPNGATNLIRGNSNTPTNLPHRTNNNNKNNNGSPGSGTLLYQTHSNNNSGGTIRGGGGEHSSMGTSMTSARSGSTGYIHNNHHNSQQHPDRSVHLPPLGGSLSGGGGGGVNSSSTTSTINSNHGNNNFNSSSSTARPSALGRMTTTSSSTSTTAASSSTIAAAATSSTSGRTRGSSTTTKDQPSYMKPLHSSRSRR